MLRGSRIRPVASTRMRRNRRVLGRLSFWPAATEIHLIRFPIVSCFPDWGS
jgi:hypothetical protein